MAPKRKSSNSTLTVIILVVVIGLGALARLGAAFLHADNDEDVLDHPGRDQRDRRGQRIDEQHQLDGPFERLHVPSATGPPADP